jgi:hypothetical protein
MLYIVLADSHPIAQFLRREDAEEFLSNAQYEDGYKLYEITEPSQQ